MYWMESLALIVSGALVSTLSLAQVNEEQGLEDNLTVYEASKTYAVESFATTMDGELLLDELEDRVTETAPTYQEISGILASNCLSCHGANRPRKGVRLDTEQFARQFASRASREILDGTMPPRKPGFGQSPEGQRLLEWFSQTPLQIER